MIKDMKKKLPFATKIKYLLMPPGWSHDGSTKTAEQLRKELKNVPGAVSDASKGVRHI